MSKLKKLLIAMLTTCVAVGVSAAAAACTDKNDNHPDFREPANYVPDDDDPTDTGNGEYKGKYVINVKSVGGLALDGVKVTAYKNGAEVVSGISMGGKVEFALDKGVYEIEISKDSLPLGYYVQDGEEFATIADKENLDVVLYSKVIPQTAPSGTSYSMGDVMYDFSFSDVSGIRYILSDLLAGGTYKAVVLNFWYVECGPCRAEFPAIEEAYSAYSNKLALLALNIRDDNAQIGKFREDNNYTFPMGRDMSGVASLFNVTAAPTTVIIDRYGAVAYRSTGTQTNASAWKGLFNTYTSDNYTQSQPTGGDNSVVPTERPKPTEGLFMPASEVISDAVLGTGKDKFGEFLPETNEKDAPYSWPWILDEDEYGYFITASNAKKQYSYAILYTSIQMEAGDALSYYYKLDTEQDCDFLYALINGRIVATHSGKSQNASDDKPYGDDWVNAPAVYVADHTVNVIFSFIYIKDQADPDDFTGDDKVSIRNLNVRPVSEVISTVDQRTSVVDKLTLKDGKYKNPAGYDFTDLGNGSLELNAKDGYYYVNYRDHLGNERKAMLLMDILAATTWAEKHLGSETFTNAESNSNPASLYHLSYWTLSNYDTADTSTPLEFIFGHDNLLIQGYYLQGFSDNSLLPVTPARKEMVDAFIKEFYNSNKSMLVEGDEYYEDQWLEFCFYFSHYGQNHEVCNEKIDPIKGLIYENAYVAVANYTAEDVANGTNVNHANITKILNLSDGGGIKYKFVPEQDGVYFFHSDFSKTGVDPNFILVDENGNEIAASDEDTRHNAFNNPKRFNFYAYATLKAGKTYYVHAAMHYAQDTGEYDFYIDYKGDHVDNLRFATTGEGVFTPDENGNLYYIAVPVAFNNSDGYYHVRTDKSQYGSVIYIDFVNQNFFDDNGHTLYWMIWNNLFDFRKDGGRDYTQKMKDYYYSSIRDKDTSDELYGKLEADKEIVNILNMLILKHLEEGPQANAWLMFGCYYEYYDVKDLVQ